MLNDVTVIRGQGGLGRALPGEDYISGLMFYTDNLPSGFDDTHRVKQVLSLAAAEALGIDGDYSDETKATGTVTITNVGSNGDTIAIYVQEPTEQVLLATYTKVSGDTTVTLVAVAIKNAINALTSSHGYTAANTAGAITITARAGLGIFLNSGTPISTVIVGTIARSITQFSGGVASELAQWHYHIAEYFRIQPAGNLWLGFFELTANTFDFAELQTMQNTATGKIRQCGVYLCNTGSFDGASDVATAADALQVQVELLESLHTPLSTIVATNLEPVADFTNLLTLANQSDSGVSVVIGQDGDGLGSEIFYAQGTSITCLGAVLGATSLAAVNENIGWIQKFNLSNGIELAKPAYSNGVLVNIIADLNLLTQLNEYKYIFLRYFPGTSGSYVQDNPTCIASSSDYAYMNDNRVIDKADRLLYGAYLPFLNGPIVLNADGTISDNDVAYLTSLGNVALDDMVRNGEVSAKEITIDPAQNVLSTNKIIITASLVPVGSARHITVKLGYVLSL